MRIYAKRVAWNKWAIYCGHVFQCYANSESECAARIQLVLIDAASIYGP